MKRFSQILLTLLMLATAMPQAQAQADPHRRGNRPSREQLAQTQAKGIAKELALDETSANRFIGLFTACQKEIWDCAPRNGARANRRGDKKELTEDEARKIIADRFAHRKQIDAIQERYYGEYSKFLTQRQILRAYNLERKMMDRMFREHMRDSGRKEGGARRIHPRGRHPTELTHRYD